MHAKVLTVSEDLSRKLAKSQIINGAQVLALGWRTRHRCLSRKVLEDLHYQKLSDLPDLHSTLVLTNQTQL